MTTRTRREFIQKVGVAVAALILSKCTSRDPEPLPTRVVITCYEPPDGIAWKVSGKICEIVGLI